MRVVRGSPCHGFGKTILTAWGTPSCQESRTGCINRLHKIGCARLWSPSYGLESLLKSDFDCSHVGIRPNTTDQTQETGLQEADESNSHPGPLREVHAIDAQVLDFLGSFRVMEWSWGSPAAPKKGLMVSIRWYLGCLEG